MATEKVTVEKITCEVCDTVHYHEKDTELPLGFYIFKGIMWIPGTGGTGTDNNLYLCSQPCLVEFANDITEYMN